MRPPYEALALSSGCALGAYQAGAMLCLAEGGFQFSRVAGTSIGILNGALYAAGGGSVASMQALCRTWLDPALAALFRGLPGRVLASALDPSRGLGRALDPGAVRDFLQPRLDLGRLRSGTVELIVTVVEAGLPLLDVPLGAWKQPSYLSSRTLGEEELWQAILGGIAHPLLMPPSSLGGRSLGDACLAAPCPARHLYETGSRGLVSILLSDGHVQDRADFPEARVLRLRPARSLDARSFLDYPATYLDFSAARIEGLIQAGYQDARQSLVEAAGRARRLEDLRRNGDVLEHLADQLPERHP